MPGTVDDFIQRFSGSQPVDHQEASQYLDKFASTAPQDQSFDNQTMYSGASEYLGKLPEQEFTQAAQNAYSSASPTQQQGLVGSIMSALQSRGLNVPGFATLSNPSGSAAAMDPDQYAQLANYARQQHPDVMQDVVRQQPWFVRAMGHPVLMGILGVVASKMIRSGAPAAQSSPQPEHSFVGGLLRKLI